MEASARLRYVMPADATWIDVPRTRAARRELGPRLRALPPGTTVVLADPAFGSRYRGRALARDANVRIERELLAIPSLRDPVFAVEDAPGPVESFWNCFATVPVGWAAPALPVSLAIRAVTMLKAWALVGVAVPGRFTVGRRT
jgi:hypothetical protein